AASEDQKRRLQLKPEQKARLRDLCGLDAAELEEVESVSFRPLGAHHLDLCFLLRGTAQALQVQGLPPQQQAAAALEWVTRQVALQEHDADLLPPQAVLRRGHGSARERALVFLALLPQLGLDGCLVVCPGAKGRPAVWLCGTLVTARDAGGKASGELCLFDPRLGVPLPGPGGQGIATLAQLKSQPDILRPLAADDKAPYDLTPEQAGRAEAYMACPLPALSKRMAYLEGVLSEGHRVRLALDPDRLR